MLVVDASSSVPPFEQLRQQIAQQIAEGTLPPGTQLPTVRRLAEDLGLAPNTVARTYRALEQTGLLRTAGRRGTVVAEPATDVPPRPSAPRTVSSPPCADSVSRPPTPSGWCIAPTRAEARIGRGRLSSRADRSTRVLHPPGGRPALAPTVRSRSNGSTGPP
jgi:DNA-binding transcriptional regulator YhcF (GntR family)